MIGWYDVLASRTEQGNLRRKTKEFKTLERSFVADSRRAGRGTSSATGTCP
jgi:hypothetical protein